MFSHLSGLFQIERRERELTENNATCQTIHQWASCTIQMFDSDKQ